MLLIMPVISSIRLLQASAEVCQILNFLRDKLLCQTTKSIPMKALISLYCCLKVFGRKVLSFSEMKKFLRKFLSREERRKLKNYVRENLRLKSKSYKNFQGLRKFVKILRILDFVMMIIVEC